MYRGVYWIGNDGVVGMCRELIIGKNSIVFEWFVCIINYDYLNIGSMKFIYKSIKFIFCFCINFFWVKSWVIGLKSIVIGCLSIVVKMGWMNY